MGVPQGGSEDRRNPSMVLTLCVRSPVTVRVLRPIQVPIAVGVGIDGRRPEPLLTQVAQMVAVG